jgi:hypothetical protein
MIISGLAEDYNSIICDDCVVPQVFRSGSKVGSPCGSMKLNKTRVHWLIRQKQKGVTSKDLAITMKLSRRRVEQIGKAIKILVTSH